MVTASSLSPRCTATGSASSGRPEWGSWPLPRAQADRVASYAQPATDRMARPISSTRPLRRKRHVTHRHVGGSQSGCRNCGSRSCCPTGSASPCRKHGTPPAGTQCRGPGGHIGEQVASPAADLLLLARPRPGSTQSPYSILEVPVTLPGRLQAPHWPVAAGIYSERPEVLVTVVHHPDRTVIASSVLCVGHLQVGQLGITSRVHGL